MNKSTRNIIISIGIIVLLIAGIVVINNIDTTENPQPLQGDESYTVYSEDTDNIANILVESDDMTVKAVNNDTAWTINDMSNDDIDPSKAYALAAAIANLTSVNKFDEPADLGQYGLDNPAITVTINKKNGDSDKLYIGDMSPTLGEYFVMNEGDRNVYTMHAFRVETLLQPISYYQEFDRFEIDIDDITGVKIARGSEVVEIRLLEKIDEDTNNVWEMLSPYKANANDDYIDNKILEPMENISLTLPLTGVDGGFSSDSPVLTIDVKPYNDVTTEYGEPYTEEMIIGKTEGGLTYVKYHDRVYQTASESVSFVNEPAFNIVSKMHSLVDISLVESVTLEYGNSSHTIDITQKDNKKYSFKLDGAETNDTVSQKVYQSIISLAVDAVYNGEPMRDTIMKITYKGIKSSDDTVVEIKPIDDINCAMVRNGKASFTIRKNKIDEFIKMFDEYVQNPDAE